MMKRNLLSRTLLLLLMVVGGVCGAWAQEITSPWSHTFSTTEKTFTEDGTENLSGVNWELAVTWSGEDSDYNVDTNNPSLGMKIGSNKKVPSSMTLSTTDIQGTITEVVVTTSGRSKSNCTLGVTVDGIDYETDDTWGGNTSKEYTFTGSEAGEIVITWTQGSSNKGAFYVTKIEITFESADGTYSVTYNSNGADGGTVPTDETKYTDENNTVTVLGNTGNLTKEHYTFAGWNTEDDGTGTGYSEGKTFTISKSTTLYAQWAANTNKVTLPTTDEYGSYSMDATNPVSYGTEVTLSYTPATGYENYVATWSINGTQIDGNKFTMPDEAVTVSVSTAEFIQPTVVTATFNNVFLGTTVGGSIAEATTVTKDGIKYTFDKNSSGSNWPRGDADLIRIYQNTTLKIEAPSGYVITSITFSNNGDWKSGMTADVGNYDDTLDENHKTYWTGMAQSVTFSPNGSHRITEVVVIVAKEATDIDIPVAKEYISYCSPYALDFTNVEGLKALVVTKVNDTSVSTEEVKTVPAGVGVILHKTDAEATSFNVPAVATATAPATNYLVGVLEATTIGGNDTDYVLKDGKFMKANAGTLAAGKAYLQVKTDANPAPALTIGFGDEGTTGIRSIENGQLTIDNVYYDLSGRRVAEPTKGVYIVNGKKVVIK